MNRYDPLSAPDPHEWLSPDEQARTALVSEFHKRAGERMPNRRFHATFHVVVENQLAEGLPEVTGVLGRLMDEGLDRHDALHAIGSVLARHLYEALQGNPGEGDMPPLYFRDLQNLPAESWRRSYESEE